MTQDTIQLITVCAALIVGFLAFFGVIMAFVTLDERKQLKLESFKLENKKLELRRMELELSQGAHSGFTPDDATPPGVDRMPPVGAYGTLGSDQGAQKQQHGE